MSTVTSQRGAYLKYFLFSRHCKPNSVFVFFFCFFFFFFKDSNILGPNYR